jgi:hypothetical protein
MTTHRKSSHTTIPDKLSGLYRDFVKKTAERDISFGPLQEFLDGEKWDVTNWTSDFEDYNTRPKLGRKSNEEIHCRTISSKIECKTNLVKLTRLKGANIPDQSEKADHSNDLIDFEDLAANLGDDDNNRKLFLLENITPKVVALFGGHWHVPPDFFLAHLENSNWYEMQNVQENLPALRSVQSERNYLRFQFIGPREFTKNPNCEGDTKGRCIDPAPFNVVYCI